MSDIIDFKKPSPTMPLNVSEQQILVASCQNIAEHCNVPVVKQYLQAFVDGMTALTTREQKKSDKMENKKDQ